MDKRVPPTAVELVEKLSRESERQRIEIEQLLAQIVELKKQLDEERQKHSARES